MIETNICDIHQTQLTVKKVPAWLGYSVLEVFDIDNI